MIAPVENSITAVAMRTILVFRPTRMVDFRRRIRRSLRVELADGAHGLAAPLRFALVPRLEIVVVAIVDGGALARHRVVELRVRGRYAQRVAQRGHRGGRRL